MKWYGPVLEFIGAPGATAPDIINFAVDTFKVIPLFDTYLFDSAEEFMEEIAAGDRAATPGTLASVTWTQVTNGLGQVVGWKFDAADLTFTAVAASQKWIIGVAIVHWDTAEASSRLVGYIDKAPVFPFKPDGGDVVFQWPATGIARLNTGV